MAPFGAHAARSQMLIVGSENRISRDSCRCNARPSPLLKVLNSTEDANEENHVRALGLNLLAGTCAVGLMLATPTPASSQPSHLSLGSVQFGAAAVEEVRHRRYRYAHRRYYRPYYRPYHRPSYSYDGWPYYYRPHYYDPG